MYCIFDPVRYTLSKEMPIEELCDLTNRKKCVLVRMANNKTKVKELNSYIIKQDTPVTELRALVEKENPPGEEWKVFDRNNNYMISNYGRFAKKKKDGSLMFLKPMRNRKWSGDKLGISYYTDGKRKFEYIATAVIRNFTNKYISGSFIINKNLILDDNFVGNLQLTRTTSKETLYKRSKKLKKKIAQVDPDDGHVIKIYKSVGEASKEHFISIAAISLYLNGKRKSCGGLAFAYYSQIKNGYVKNWENEKIKRRRKKYERKQ